jgi:hypothetical protein
VLFSLYHSLIALLLAGCYLKYDQCRIHSLRVLDGVIGLLILGYRGRYEYLSILERDNHRRQWPFFLRVLVWSGTDDDDTTDLHGQERALDSSPPSQHHQKRTRSSSYQSHDSTSLDGTEPDLMGFYHCNAARQMPGIGSKGVWRPLFSILFKCSELLCIPRWLGVEAAVFNFSPESSVSF